jgi:aminoglycoside phosphotransferase (APT) family kinase protein
LDDLVRARSLLERAGSPITPVAVEPLGSGVKSTVLRVRDEAGEQFALKLYAEGTERAAEREIAFHNAVGDDHGLPIPRLVASSVDDEDAPNGFTLVTIEPGRLMKDIVDDVFEDELHGLRRQIGAFLAQLHQTPVASFGELVPHQPAEQSASAMGFTTWAIDQELASYLEHDGNRALAARIAAWVRERAPLLDQTTNPKLLHLDLHEGNVMVQRVPGGTPVMRAVIDFECAGGGDPVSDFARSTTLQRGGGTEQALDAMLEGYGGLPDGWRDRYDVYRVQHTFSLLRWYRKNVSGSGVRGCERTLSRIVGANRRAKMGARLRGRNFK